MPAHAPPRSQPAPNPPRVGLFVTCLVDLFRPSIGFASVKLLEESGCAVEAPGLQTCCGQPAYNSGDSAGAAAIAKQTIVLFEPFDYVVAPSGSCAGMLKAHYPKLLATEGAWAARAERLASRTHELVSFLHDVRGVRRLGARHEGIVTYHDSCSGLRELGVKAQPRALLGAVAGLTLVELPGAEVCCGFGGTFCVKYAEISDRMASHKADDIHATGAGMLLAGDLGCLMNIAGKLKRLAFEEGRQPVACRHVAEVLAGALIGPAIGEAKS